MHCKSDCLIFKSEHLYYKCVVQSCVPISKVGWAASRRWSASREGCCYCNLGGLLYLKVLCCTVLGLQKTHLSLYMVILIAVLCGAVVFLVIFTIVCIRKPKEGEWAVLESLNVLCVHSLVLTLRAFGAGAGTMFMSTCSSSGTWIMKTFDQTTHKSK